MNENREWTPEIDAALKELTSSFGVVIRKQRLDAFGTFNRLAQPNGIVLVGDSIIEGFPIHELYRGPLLVYNRGISGDTSRDVLNRLEESVYALRPAKVFLLIGTNDIETSTDARMNSPGPAGSPVAIRSWPRPSPPIEAIM